MPVPVFSPMTNGELFHTVARAFDFNPDADAQTGVVLDVGLVLGIGCDRDTIFHSHTPHVIGLGPTVGRELTRDELIDILVFTLHHLVSDEVGQNTENVPFETWAIRQGSIQP